MNVESLLMGLTAKGVTWDPHRVVGCFNSANLRGLEHAALLRGLTGPALAWAYWQYLGDNSQITPISRHWAPKRQNTVMALMEQHLKGLPKPHWPNICGRYVTAVLVAAICLWEEYALAAKVRVGSS